MGIRASSTTTVSFADVKVPPENVLDAEGKGFKVAMAILNNGRTGLGGGAVGGMKTLIGLAVQQSQARKQFGEPIANFRLIREKIAQMTVECFAAESVVWMVAHYIDSGDGRLLGRGGDQQGLRERSHPARGLRGAADRRGQRLHAGRALRADRARLPHPVDLRGNQRGAAALYRALGLEGSRQVATAS